MVAESAHSTSVWCRTNPATWRSWALNTLMVKSLQKANHGSRSARYSARVSRSQPVRNRLSRSTTARGCPKASGRDRSGGRSLELMRLTLRSRHRPHYGRHALFTEWLTSRHRDRDVSTDDARLVRFASRIVSHLSL